MFADDKTSEKGLSDSLCTDLYRDYERQMHELSDILVGRGVQQTGFVQRSVPTASFAVHNTDDGWICTCGVVNKGKFCSECGAKKPAGAPLYRCNRCDWSLKIRRLLRDSDQTVMI